MPTSTDLVTDLPADFETFGQAVDTSLAELKGGTTGQVLSKTSNTDMDFTWVTSDDANAIQNTIVDAKGDLIAASASDVPARLAVGNDGETLVADSSTATGLRYQNNYASGKNTIINGAFNVWQRGTSFSVTSAVYTADRYRCSADTATTFSQQAFTAGTAPVAGYEATFFLRAATGAGTSYVDVAQPIEDVRTFAGQTATLSFWAKANSATTLVSFFRQSFGSGGSADVDTSGSSLSLTTSWQRFTFTVAIPSISGKTIGTGSFLMPVLYCNSGAASKSIDIWGVQFEAGSVATAFQTATGTIQGELAACQRYYQRFDFDTDGLTGFFGNAYSTTAVALIRDLAVPLRTTQTTVDYSNFRLYDFVNGYTITSLVGWSSAENHTAAVLATGASGLTQYRVYYGANNGSAGYIAIGAEL